MFHKDISKNRDELVVAGPAQVLVTQRGKTVAIDRNNILINRD